MSDVAVGLLCWAAFLAFMAGLIWLCTLIERVTGRCVADLLGRERREVARQLAEIRALPEAPPDREILR